MKFILTVIVAILSVSYAVEIKETKANEASKKFLQEYAEREVRLRFTKTTTTFNARTLNTGYCCTTLRFDVPCFGAR